MTTTSHVSHFGRVLHEIFEEHRAAARKPDSIRSLARTMGAGDEGRAAVAKRSLHKWISGRVKPSLASRAQVAQALDVSADRFADPDDEEPHPAMRRAFDLFVDLMGQVAAAQGTREHA